MRGSAGKKKKNRVWGDACDAAERKGGSKQEKRSGPPGKNPDEREEKTEIKKQRGRRKERGKESALCLE